MPPPGVDLYPNAWQRLEADAALAQVNYYTATRPHACYGSAGVWGLSAAEVPAPWMVSRDAIYQPFGTGGSVAANDGTSVLGRPVIVPHASAMLAAVRPADAERVWRVLFDVGVMTPLTNVESAVAGPSGACENVFMNRLRGSLNLALQALGWGRYLTRDEPLLQRAILQNEFTARGYQLMTR